MDDKNHSLMDHFECIEDPRLDRRKFHVDCSHGERMGFRTSDGFSSNKSRRKD
jgi:hypothetical protein